MSCKFPKFCDMCTSVTSGIIGRRLSSLQGNCRWSFGSTLAAVAVGSTYRLHSYWSARRRRPLASKQVVAITGCDTGLGYSLALHCRDKGATVVAGVLQPDGPGAKDLGERGVMILGLDVTEEESVEKFGEELRKMLESEELELRALVNNAGVMIFGEFEWQLPRQARLQVEVNVLGTMSVTRKLLPQLRRHRSRIVNVTSHCALASLPGLAIYGATKAALLGWSDSLRVELGKYGVSVVNFIPGSFPMQSNIFTSQSGHFAAMRAEMSSEARDFYADYFDRYAGYLEGLSRDNGLRRLENSRLYEIFDAAMLECSPKAVYKCEPWRYTFYHTLFRITPTPLRDWLVERFVQMPSWTTGKR